MVRPTNFPSCRRMRRRAAGIALGVLASTLVLTNGPGTTVAGAVDRYPDVSDANPDHDSIDFVGDKGWLTGYADGEFKPDNSLSRQAMVAVLYRMSDSPAGPFPDPGFTDDPTTGPFVTPIRWAAAEGITTGYADGSFKPTAPVSRQAIIVQLHRLSGMSRVYTYEPFTDVVNYSKFRGDIAWAWTNNLSDPFTDPETFRPTDPTLRGPLATLLETFDTMMGGFWPTTISADHHGTCTDPVTAEQQAAADQLVIDVKAYAIPNLSTKAQAEAAGYVMNAPAFDGLGPHYINWDYMDDGILLDPSKPESLFFGTGADATKVQGEMFIMPKPGDEGPMIGGCLTPWHAHDNLCYNSEGNVVWIATMGGCVDNSLMVITPEMLHVWIVDNPGGPFEGLET